MNSDMLVAEISSSGCSVDRVGLTFRYSSKDAVPNFSRALDVEVLSNGQTSKVFFPVYETGATNPVPERLVFDGLEVADAELPCVKRIARFARPDRYPLLLMTVLPPEWRSMQLVQTLRGRGRGLQAISYWAPMGLRDRRSGILARLASAPAGVNTGIDYAARIATVGSNAAIAVNGVADGPNPYPGGMEGDAAGSLERSPRRKVNSSEVALPWGWPTRPVGPSVSTLIRRVPSGHLCSRLTRVSISSSSRTI